MNILNDPNQTITFKSSSQFLVHDLLLAIQVPKTPKKERDQATEKLKELCKFYLMDLACFSSICRLACQRHFRDSESVTSTDQ